MYKLCGVDSVSVAVPVHVRGEVRGQLMIFKAFIISTVLVGITLVLTEIHRYMVYKADIEQEDK